MSSIFPFEFRIHAYMVDPEWNTPETGDDLVILHNS